MCTDDFLDPVGQHAENAGNKHFGQVFVLKRQQQQVPITLHAQTGAKSRYQCGPKT